MTSVSLPIPARTAGTAYQDAVETFGPQIVRALRAVLPKDLRISLTIVQRRGKLRVEMASLFHESGWTDASG